MPWAGADVTVFANGGAVDRAAATVSDSAANTHDLNIDAGPAAVTLAAVGSGALNPIKGLNITSAGAVTVGGQIVAGSDGVQIGSLGNPASSISVSAGSSGNEEIKDATPGAIVKLTATGSIGLNDYAIGAAGDVTLSASYVADTPADAITKISTPGTLTIRTANGAGGIGGSAELDTAVGTLDVTNSNAGDIGIAQTGAVNVRVDAARLERQHL